MTPRETQSTNVSLSYLHTSNVRHVCSAKTGRHTKDRVCDRSVHNGKKKTIPPVGSRIQCSQIILTLFRYTKAGLLYFAYK